MMNKDHLFKTEQTLVCFLSLEKSKPSSLLQYISASGVDEEEKEEAFDEPTKGLSDGLTGGILSVQPPSGTKQVRVLLLKQCRLFKKVICQLTN